MNQLELKPRSGIAWEEWTGTAWGSTLPHACFHAEVGRNQFWPHLDTAGIYVGVHPYFGTKAKKGETPYQLDASAERPDQWRDCLRRVELFPTFEQAKAAGEAFVRDARVFVAQMPPVIVCDCCGAYIRDGSRCDNCNANQVWRCDGCRARKRGART